MKLTYPTVTSKRLEPTEEETTISPLAFLTTMILVIKSGMDVATERKTKPITLSFDKDYYIANCRIKNIIKGKLCFAIML